MINDFEIPRHQNFKIDPSQFRQALYNIIFNAVEAMPEGGTLTVKTSFKEFSEILQKNFDPSTMSFMEISISDTGVGIRQEHLPFIFDPFFSPGDKKKGLGLSIAHKIIRNHAGDILVRSEVNKGATFIIELPVKR